MPKRMNLLPPGITLAPGTPVYITHSGGRKGREIKEVSYVNEDGISTQTCMDSKTLEGLRMSKWKVQQGNNWYYNVVCTADLCIKNTNKIYLCNKNKIPGSRAHSAASFRYSRSKYTPKKSQKLIINNNNTEVTQCLEAFLESQLQNIPTWYRDSSWPGPHNFRGLIDFITPPQEEEASTSAATKAILERTTVKTTSSTKSTDLTQP